MTINHQTKINPEETVTQKNPKSVKDHHKMKHYLRALLAVAESTSHLILPYVLYPWINKSFTVYLFGVIIYMYWEYTYTHKRHLLANKIKQLQQQGTSLLPTAVFPLQVNKDQIAPQDH